MNEAAVTARNLRSTPVNIAPPPATARPVVQISSTQARKKILFVTSELTGLVKTGGLADVSAALPSGLLDRHDVRVLMPAYASIIDSGLPIRIVGNLGGLAGIPPCAIGRLDMDDGLIVYLLLCPELYQRPGNPYSDEHGRDWPDNPVRFARLGLAAAEIAAGTACIRWAPDLVHAHDWQAGLAPAYMHWRGLSTPSVFTIHNLAYQGTMDMGYRRALGIPVEACHHDRMEFYGKLSMLKAGIAYANHVTTVSPTYAQEITTAEFGCGLEGFLGWKDGQGLLSGILNGIDESWDPQTDTHLQHNFSANDWSGKAANKALARQRFGLPEHDGPLFAVVSRLAQQKGLDLTMAIADTLVQAGAQLAILGCGEPHIEDDVRALALLHPEQISVHIGFNEPDARLLFAGSDFLLMPSRYEPCGLSQMYAQRFGSLPVARRTGGLADSIEDGLTGFLFDQADPAHYRLAIERALATYRHPDLLEAMRRRAMSAGFFWRQATDPYDSLYQRLLGERQEAVAQP